MEKQLFKLAGLVISAMLLGACSQLATFENEDLLTNQEAASIMDPSTFTSGFGFDPSSNARMLYGSADCTNEETYCVSSSNYYYKTDDKSWNAPGLGGVYLEYYQNVAGELVYSFDSYKNNNGKDPNLVGYSIDGGDIIPVSKSSTITVTIPLEEDWEPCDEVERTITVYRNSQHSLSFTTSYTLLAVCDDGDDGTNEDCEVEEFYYNQVAGFTYDFTYIPCEALTGVTLKWTSPHIKGFSSSTPGIIANKGKAKGSPTVLSWTGNVPADGITFSITFDPECAQNNAGFALLWTDFKVNEVSKKYLNSDNINILNTNCPGKK
ncbi:hypothetical protein [Algoriphagus aquimarinus]|uniref:CUB domain-containing protein n=1 Tax=Algoriphagus aquimarinus TaxID=237018 RepID=A0A1I1BJN1_9BACT|nr:hypothetical protein [Algoriphagus aquimarinus]SFB48690.1 hypothetical protein SAMN04489723_1135 [Algoriphagus aquimarinus]